MGKKSKLAVWLGAYVVILLFAMFGYIYFSSIETNRFHIDEYQFLKKTYYFDLFFLDNNFTDDRWLSDSGDDFMQPKLGIYIYGLAFHAVGIADIEDYLETIRFNAYKVGGEEWGRSIWGKPLTVLPMEVEGIVELVKAGRMVAVGFTLVSLGLIFWLGRKIYGSLFGWLALLLIGTNPLLSYFGRLAMTDSMQLFFFYLTFLLSLFLAKTFEEKNIPKLIMISGLLGFSTAFAAGVKVSGIMALIFVNLVFMAKMVTKLKKKKLWSIALNQILLNLVFGLVFVYLHPYLYENTLARFYFMFADRLKAAEDYKLIFPGAAVDGPIEGIKITVSRLLLPRGRHTNDLLLGSDLILFLGGVYLTTKRAITSLKQKRIEGESLIVIWLLVLIVCLFVYLKNVFPRYFLPLASVIALVQAYGLSWLIKRLKVFLENRVNIS